MEPSPSGGRCDPHGEIAHLPTEPSPSGGRCDPYGEIAHLPTEPSPSGSHGALLAGTTLHDPSRPPHVRPLELAVIVVRYTTSHAGLQERLVAPSAHRLSARVSANRHLVLCLTALFRPHGGIQRFNRMLCLALDQLAPSLGLELTVLSQNDREEDYLLAGSPWRKARFLEGGGKSGLALRAMFLCARTRPEGLVIGHLGMSPVGLACAPFLSRGFAVIAHGTEAWEVPQWSRRVAVRRARRAFAVSSHTAEMLVRSTGCDSASVRLLANTLEPDFRAAPEEGAEAARPDADPPAGDRPEILTVARLWAEEGQKGVDHMLEAVARLAGDRPGLRYRIVGKGSDKPRLLALIERLGIGDQVVFEEDLSDAELARRYRACTLFALPSGQEGFGIVFLEAMRFGKAVVGCDSGGIPDVVESGVTGLLVPFGNVDALTAAIDRVLSDANLRASMGSAGRARLEERFTFPRFRQQVESHVREWLDV